MIPSKHELQGVVPYVITFNALISACQKSSQLRVAFIINTFFIALDDLFHFMILFSVIFIGFAVIATWRFGS